MVLGAGGHAKVVIDILRADPKIELVGCIDKDPSLRSVARLPVLGDDSLLAGLHAQGIQHAFIAIGSNRVRQQLGQQLESLGFRLVSAISPFSWISDSAQLGDGVAVMPGAVINAEAKIGRLSIINTGATVDHECDIGEACHIAPGSALSGNVTVGKGTFLGTGTRVIDAIEIGPWAMVGAGSVVTRPLPGRCTAVGVPCRVIKLRTDD
ncbi:acetyltransferase [Paenibacillus caseinilyticus]|uniref:acetyltransferase n=1 Tax=Paenibacillus mucilaginosus TaxID=61624 RepID=UPI0009D9C93D|nr:acetyltransferase [Paenibacillus mucilaginosus]WFA19004.1 acetyltransferase [Paenibacillus mucilaginosus]